MAASSRSAREAKRRIQQMEAKRELRRDQEKRRKRDNLIAAGAGTAAVLLAVVLQLTAFAGNPTEDEYAAGVAGLTNPRDSPAPSAPATNGANIPAADTAAGKVFTGEMALNGNVLGVEIDGTKAPQAAAVFKALTDEGFYNGSACHRLTTGETFGLLQCGGATAAADPGYTWGPLENTPADNAYPAGTIAIARSGDNAYGNGKQFFVVYKDTVIPADSAGGYTVVGKVTSGMEAVNAIAAAGITPGSSASDGAPVQPVTIDSVSLK
ncbi:peptidylprolyl isomerase [Pseudarthrobacter sp. NBSH8]|uniref:peptidylprolyl isomerase n=1 Tax=Pseudarthrobacter sp. NBSH8 TaxID=2596911 RepID=UPI001627D5E4|nr:peptidylprolyl isomerase [Pseudarthrobacter sp. NBSH8]QNE14799.1 peptidylprolyl isomerase [Pseudarthrobacter sp. NBSH8]